MIEMNADDVPASHSMDSDWFAVDQQGHVAVFSTGENGHLPEFLNEAGETGREALDLLESFLQARRVRDVRGGTPERSLADLSFQDYCDRIASLGLFLYCFDDYEELNPELWILDLYRRKAEPGHPVHVEELPPQLRRLCKQINFECLFAEVERIQPVGTVPCVCWGEAPPAYLCGDGRTVKLLPGKEKEAARIWKKLRKSERDALAAYEIEGMPAASAAQRKAPRRKRKKRKGS
jgi:hypothetical protein